MKYKGKFNLIEFVRPETRYNFWPYTTEQAMGVYRQMCITAIECKSPVYGPVALLSKVKCYDPTEVDPILSLADLHERFHYALLGCDSPAIKRWREKHGWLPTNTVELRFKHYRYAFESRWPNDWMESSVGRVLDFLFAQQNTKLNVQLNDYHPRATTIHQVRLWADADGFRFDFAYGYARLSSRWYYGLAASQKPNEPFLDVLARAVIRFQELTRKAV